MSRRSASILAASLAAFSIVSCGGATSQKPAAEPPAQVEETRAPADLGPKPTPPPPASFVPELPQVFAGPGGSTVWLFERHSLPLVSMAVAVPYGSAAEPTNQPGLAFVSADMLDEGAGKLDPLAYAAALDLLGARLASHASRDTSLVTLEVLAEKFPDALSLLADAILRPRHVKQDYERVHSLWTNNLLARAQEPSQIAQVVTAAAYYGLDSPYGSPVDGTLASAKRIGLADVTRWHKTIWRPDKATFVIAGDVKKDDALATLEKAFAGWKAPKTKAPEVVAPKPPKQEGLRTVIVEREDAPQVIMSVASAGVSASDPAYPLLSLVNVVLGGSFSSRLNQVLREDHGWTYGARSGFTFQRGTGMFVARAAIRTDAISDALGVTLEQIRKLGREGLSEQELETAKAQKQSDAVEGYGTLHGVVSSLAGNAMAGLGPDADAKMLAAEREATIPQLRELSSRFLELPSATIVLVGPREATQRALEANGLPSPEVRDADGNLVSPVQESRTSPKPR